MLTGRFGDTSGRPYLEGRLFLPRLEIRGDISFCVDTGADRSVLNPADGKRIGVNYDALTEQTESVGIGGSCQNFLEPAWVVFSEAKRSLYVYRVPVEISPPNEDIMDLPSLLGRDILDRWQMVYDPINKVLTFGVHSADVTVPITP